MVYLNHCKEFLLIWLFSYFVINIAINEILPFVTITHVCLNLTFQFRTAGWGISYQLLPMGLGKWWREVLGRPAICQSFFDYMHFLQDICCHPPTPELRRGGSRIPRRRGRQPSGGAPTFDFAKFCEKLHEIEKNLGRRGGAP